MSEKPHNVAIGAFIVGALLIVIVTVIFVAGSGLGKGDRIVMVFDGSVKGLNVGAPVALRGVQVGQVTDIDVVLNADSLEILMLVTADFQEDAIKRIGSTTDDVTEELIARGLRAQLNTQSLLTGLLYVQLDFYPDSPINLADIDSPHYQFPTIPTDLERIAMKLEKMDFAKLAGQIETAIEGVNTLVTSEDFQAMPTSLRTTLDSVTTLSNQLQSQLATSMPKVDRVLDGTAVTVESANVEIPRISRAVTDNLEALNQAILAFDGAMEDIDGMVSPESPTAYRLNEALKELALAARAMQQLAKTLDEQPEALIRGRRGD
ncbi:MAG: MlaD family protein [Lysobacterales bacterium]|jgi:paraquat-inducible protein B